MDTHDVSSVADLDQIQDRLGIRFVDTTLLVSALTHRSFAFEHEAGPHNERLEFLGDAVLGLAITDMIFNWYPDLPEGEMAKLRSSTVNMAVLAEASRSLGLGDALFLGRGEELSGGRNKSSILADAFEAVLGAAYLDRGMPETRQLIERCLAEHIRDLVEHGRVRDFKTGLQEIAARLPAVPEYRVISSGPDHAKRFKAEVFLAGELRGAGEGGSKKEAEQAAAKEALEGLTERS
ncbi:MAG TPA: ribonuclease III [Actinomycetota bacterium]|nr:ribonuclease III [Actinomycetota bacterium]